MLKRIKQVILALTASVALFSPMLVAVPAHAADADINSGLCQGANLKVENGCSIDTAASDGTTKINGIITTVINLFSLVVGIVAVIMIILGGLKYITSGGDSGNITGAKNTILYAVIGLVVVALAQIIVKFVLGKAIKGDTGSAIFLFF